MRLYTQSYVHLLKDELGPRGGYSVFGIVVSEDVIVDRVGGSKITQCPMHELEASPVHFLSTKRIENVNVIEETRTPPETHPNPSLNFSPSDNKHPWTEALRYHMFIAALRNWV